MKILYDGFIISNIFLHFAFHHVFHWSFVLIYVCWIIQWEHKRFRLLSTVSRRSELLQYSLWGGADTLCSARIIWWESSIIQPFAYWVVREHLRGRLKVNGWETLIQTIWMRYHMNMNEQQILCWKCGNTFDMLTKIKHRSNPIQNIAHTNFLKSF